jgi:putative membrane protein
VVGLNDKERNHPLKMVNDFFNFLPKYIFLIIVPGKSAIENNDYFLFLIILLVVFFLYFIFAFIGWRKSTFILTEDSINVQNGVFNIKKSEILFERIHSIDISQNILHKILNVVVLKIDNGSSAEKGSEVKLLLSKRRAYDLQRIVQGEKLEPTTKKDEISNEVTTEVNLEAKQLLLYCVLSNSLFQSLLVILSVVSFFKDYISDFFNVDLSKYTSGIMEISLGYRIFLIFILIIISLLIAVITSIFMKFILYYGFKLHTEENNIKIQYGIFNTKNYSLDRKKIRAVILEQSFLMQKLGYATIKVESSGYGDEKNEDAILYPFISIGKKDALLQELLPEFLYNNSSISSTKKSYLSFYYLWIFISSIITIVFLLFNKKLLLIAPLIWTILLYQCHLRYKNNAAGRSETLFYISFGGFKRTQAYIKEKAVQSITKSQNPFQKKRCVCNYTINLQGFLVGKDYAVKHIITEYDNIMLE